ncbi:MAG: hypothetical protein ACLPVW_19160 [Terriglobales bacterium]
MNAAGQLIAVALTCLALRTANSQETTISVAEARSLVKIVLRHQGFPSLSHYCQIESMDKEGEPFIPDYYSFNASCDFPNTAATSPWGEYIVSPRTGDVLEFELCKWFRYSDLRRMQKQIVLRTHATEATEAQYRGKIGCVKAK